MQVSKTSSSSIHVNTHIILYMNKNFRNIAVAALAVSMLTGCNIYKKFELPKDSELAQQYAQAQEQPVDSAAFGNLDWHQVFTDPVLTDLIEQALANNTNLKNAMLNVDMAHASLKGARLSFLPSLALAPNGAGAKYGTGHGRSFGWSYTIPAQVSWEIDVFGKLLNNKRNAQAAYEQTQDYAQAVRSQIISATANTYYAIVALENQLKLSRTTAEKWRENVQVMKDFKEAGRVNEAAVVQSNAQYYSILASITDIEVSLDEMYNTMSLLLNVMPQKWSVSPDAVLEVPAMYRESVPMRELAARPDVRAAERGLAAAYYTTAGARAAFYPGLNITANGGFTNLLGSMISNPGDFFIQLAGSLTIPLFSRGANIARLEAAKAQQQQAMNTFEYTLMSASAEVSDAMTLYAKSGEKRDLLRTQVENLEKSVEITEELLSLGTSGTTYLEVLTAQQSLLAAQMNEITCENNRARAVINLYQSLGGGR